MEIQEILKNIREILKHIKAMRKLNWPIAIAQNL
jgi:hypothetical protein